MRSSPGAPCVLRIPQVLRESLFALPCEGLACRHVPVASCAPVGVRRAPARAVGAALRVGGPQGRK